MLIIYEKHRSYLKTLYVCCISFKYTYKEINEAMRELILYIYIYIYICVCVCVCVCVCTKNLYGDQIGEKQSLSTTY